MKNKGQRKENLRVFFKSFVLTLLAFLLIIIGTISARYLIGPLI